MEPLVAELKHQYHSTLAMYQSVLEGCPDELWNKEFAGVPFWREVYHTIFWIHNFLGPKDKTFHMHPFGKDIDPRLFTPPNNTCERAEVLGYAVRTQDYVDEVFESLTLEELSGADHYEESKFRSVYHRLMYGLRHGQHHVGKLTAYLNLERIQLHHWKG
ncbi:MAG: DinB family protein [Anaerolineae bacterium]|nr:DinB family protein [Anaerolineae bacterium]